MEHFDVIVVGAGSSGGVLASRLIEDPDRSVLLLEAGSDFPDEEENPPLFVVSGERSWVPAGVPEFDWGFYDEPAANGHRVRLPRGKLVARVGTVGAWMRERDSAEIMALLERFDVVAGLVYDVADIFADPHYEARDNIVSVPDVDFGRVKMPGVVPRFSRSPGTVRFPGGELGQDNEQVFAALGLDPERLAALREEGVV